jgi:peroxiredoxin family protein
VKHLKGAFDDAKKNGITDLSAIVQSYNFGRAYLVFISITTIVSNSDRVTIFHHSTGRISK